MKYRFFLLENNVTVDDKEIEACIEASIGKNDKQLIDAVTLIKSVLNSDESVLCNVAVAIYERILIMRLKSNRPGYLRIEALDEYDIRTVMMNSIDNDVNSAKIAIVFAVSEKYGFEVIT